MPSSLRNVDRNRRIVRIKCMSPEFARAADPLQLALPGGCAPGEDAVAGTGGVNLPDHGAVGCCETRFSRHRTGTWPEGTIGVRSRVVIGGHDLTLPGSFLRPFGATSEPYIESSRNALPFLGKNFRREVDSPRGYVLRASGSLCGLTRFNTAADKADRACNRWGGKMRARVRISWSIWVARPETNGVARPQTTPFAALPRHTTLVRKSRKWALPFLGAILSASDGPRLRFGLVCSPR